MAEYFDRDLVDILMDPIQAANTLSFDFPMPEKFRRARRLCGQNNPELAGRLFEILKSSGPYPSFLRICQENGISITTLLNSYPDFVRRLDSLKLHYVVTRKKYLAAKIQRARAYLARNIRHDLTGSGRALAKRLSEKCDIPLHLARGLVKASLGLQATESIMDHVKSSDVRKYSAEWKKVALENSGKITAEEYMQLHKPETHGHRKN